MDKTNKITSVVENLKHNFHIKKRRKLSLKLNYSIGLINELTKNLDFKLDNDIKRVNRFFEEDTQIAQMRLSGNHQHTEIIIKKMSQYDKKIYWKQRRFKTIHKNDSNLNELLAQFDRDSKVKKDLYLEKIKKAYPKTSYTQKEQDHFQSIINKHLAKKESKLAKIQLKYERNQGKVKKQIVQLEIKKQIIEQKVLKLIEFINVYNQKTLKQDTYQLNEVTNLLASSKLEARKIESLTRKKEDISNKLFINATPEVHLSVFGLKMYFGGIKAVNDLSFDVKKGEIFGLIGPNGAGKTTVFNCITQFYKPTAGSIYFKNKEDDIANLSKLNTHDMISEGIARSFQNIELIWELTVLDNLLVASHSLLLTDFIEHMMHTKKMKREEMVLRTKGYQILNDLGIAEYAFRSPYGLSYGVLKKIELARTLMTNPSLIILDEPAAGLNDAETEELAHMIKKINQDYNVTIFLVEHDMGLVMSICDTVCVISFGKKIAIGKPIEVQNNPEVRKAYLGEDDDE